MLNITGKLPKGLDAKNLSDAAIKFCQSLVQKGCSSHDNVALNIQKDNKTIGNLSLKFTSMQTVEIYHAQFVPVPASEKATVEVFDTTPANDEKPKDKAKPAKAKTLLKIDWPTTAKNGQNESAPANA